MALMNRQWVLRQRPQGLVQDADLELVTHPVPDLEDGQVLIRTIYLSLDPTNRTWMNDAVGYLPPVGLGDVMRGLTLGVVEQSRSGRFAEGDIVSTAMGGWGDYGVVADSAVSKVHRAPGLPLTANMSVMGMTGMTAYFGVTDVLRPEPGQTMVISAAAGAVGSIAGQVAKQRGARVIGIAGGPEKCRWLVEELGFDGAVDYKNEDVGEALDRLCPDGIDLNFENVGGDIMIAVWNRLNLKARMAVCGMVSAYNATKRPPSPDLSRLITHRMTVQGFLVMDYAPRAKEMVAELGPWLASGKVKWKVHVDDGLEGAVTSLNRLFTGDHDGKLLVRVSEEPAS
ncbi:Putative NADP-dependent oxidoreductase YfmJ [Brevundimonas subvibrioides]|uniref:Alcohol dehydrogenase zinc-binding domain protein n=1 Tax=Brevundimonas subvibrioides (strain ATCC 15264 / DSM 4735 / LMG 14903 / NBRC 16000 / CB 81) TaxID=633149 RepID=D9QIH1_BRESC|nr:NADP-dependent oxidoreductase [Brevundimonas subvibrioides]ADK99473.1 Alcohol dehydrogenase zinc-binding domain protein [Brevundimonas subvibrioides ATCC 15264]